jgi:hypothetical protein
LFGCGEKSDNHSPAANNICKRSPPFFVVELKTQPTDASNESASIGFIERLLEKKWIARGILSDNVVGI